MLRVLLCLLVAASADAAGREIAPPSYAASLYGASNIRVAASGSTFLTVWRGAGSAVRGSLSDDSGTLLTPVSFAIIPDGDADWIDLVAVPDGYALFWGDDEVVSMARLDERGALRSRRVLDVPGDLHAEAAWNGTNFLLAGRRVFNSSQPRLAYLLSGEGHVERAVDLGHSSGTSRVAATGSGFAVSLFDPDALNVVRLSSSGEVTQRIGVARRELLETYFPFGHAISSDGDAIVVAWQQFLNAGGLTLTMSTIDAAGNVTARAMPIGAAQPLEILRLGDRLILFATSTSGAHMMPVTGGAPTLVTAEQFGALAVATNGSKWYLAGSRDNLLTGRSERGTDVLAIASTTHVRPQIARLGDRYLVTWVDHSWGADRIQATVVDARLNQTPVIEFANTPGFLGPHAVASNGEEALVVWVHGSATYAGRIGLDGALRGDTLLLAVDKLRWPAVAATSAGFVVASLRGTTVESVLVTSSGVGPLQSTTLDVTVRPSHGVAFNETYLAWNGRHLLLVARGYEQLIHHFPIFTPQTPRLVATRLNATGAVLDRAALDLGQDSASASVAAAPHGDFLIVWDDDEGTVAVVIDDDLQPRQPERVFHWRGTVRTAVDWNGRFILGQRYSVGDQSFVAIRELDGRGRAASVAHPFDFAPDLAGALVVAPERTGEGVQRTFVYGEHELEPMAARPSAPGGANIVAFGSDTIEVTWVDLSDNERGFVIEQRVGGVWRRIALAPPDATRAVGTLVSTGAVRVRAWNEGGMSDASEDSVPRRRSVRR